MQVKNKGFKKTIVFSLLIVFLCNVIYIHNKGQDGVNGLDIHRAYAATTNSALEIEFQEGQEEIEVTTSSVIKITTIDDLYSINDNLHGDYVLEADIDLEGENFSALGTTETPFTGTFDGNGYAIKNLTIDQNKNQQGIFSNIVGGSIKNLSVHNATVKGNSYVGILAGEMQDGSIENCSISGDVSVYAKNIVAGGLIGEGENVRIINSSSSGDIWSNNYSGGLIGRINIGRIENSEFEGSVESKNNNAGGISGESFQIDVIETTSISTINGNNNVGGLFGYIYNSSITDSIWQGEVYAKNQRAGGIVGLAEETNILRCISYGDVTGNNFIGLIGGEVKKGSVEVSYSIGQVDGGKNFIGGLLGNVEQGEVSNVYTFSDVTGLNHKGGVVGTAMESDIVNAYAVGTIDGDKIVGGIVSQIESGQVIHSYFNQDTYQISTPSDQSKTIEELKQQSTYEQWDFSNYWNIEDGHSTPVLDDLPVPIHENLSYYEVELTDVSTNSITIGFDEIFLAEEYDIEFEGEIVDTIRGTSYTFTDLEPGTVYTIRLRAKNDEIVAMFSEPKELITLPSVPENVTVYTENYDNVISFDPVQGADTYEVEVLNTPVDTSGNTTYIHTNLAPNTQYTYRVRAKNESGVGAWSTLVVQKTLPGVVKGLNTIEEENQILLQWDSVPGALLYEVIVDDSVIIETSESEYTHNNLSAGTEHSYKVRAKNSEGFGPYSSQVKAYTLLEKPKNITITPGINAINIQFDGVDGAQYYEIQVNGKVENIGLDTYYVHEGIDPNTENSYRLRAVSLYTQSLWTVEYKTSTLSKAPQNLVAEASVNQIKLSWDNILLADEYEVEINGQIHRTSVPLYTFTDLLPATTYQLRVRAVTEAGNGEWSDIVEAITNLPVPENIQSNLVDNDITITWDAVVGATSYELVVDGKIIDNGNATTYTHYNLEPNSTHIYKVRAKNGEITSDFSTVIEVTTLIGIPGNLRTEGKSNSILVQWDTVEGATGYDIEIDGQIIELGNVTSYEHNDLLPNTSYQYRIRAKNDIGIGTFSEYVVQITAPDIPIPPETPDFYDIIREDESSNTYKIILYWNEVDGATAYDLEVDGVIISDLNHTQYEHTHLQPNTRHEYRLRAKNEAGTSEWSKLVEINTPVELSISMSKDEFFNFVTVIPHQEGENTRTVEVIYNSEELEVVDLCSLTSEINKTEGKINGTNISVESFQPGKIVFSINDADKTVMNIIKFQVKQQGFSQVVYEIK